MNRLNTRGVAISGNIGIGVRYASGNNLHGGSSSQQHHQESSSNIYDRYLGTTFNIGSNLHFASNEQGQTGASHSQQPGGIGNSQKEEDSIKRLGTDNSTSRQTTLWNKLNHYFTGTKTSDSSNATFVDCNENDEYENCTEAGVSKNALTRFFGKYFNKNEPRKLFSDNETVPEMQAIIQRRIFNESNHNESSLFNRISRYFNKYKFPTIIEQIWNDRSNINPNHNESVPIKNDYETFRSVVREFLVDRISSYISQNSTNENFFQKIIKKSLSQVVNESPSHETKGKHSNERSTFMKYLSEYFTNEKIKSLFPDIETIRNNLRNFQWWEYESSYATAWLKNNLPNLKNKYFSGGQLKHLVSN